MIEAESKTVEQSSCIKDNLTNERGMKLHKHAWHFEEGRPGPHRGFVPRHNGPGWGLQGISSAGGCCEGQVEGEAWNAKGKRYSIHNHLTQGKHIYFKPWYFCFGAKILLQYFLLYILAYVHIAIYDYCYGFNFLDSLSPIRCVIILVYVRIKLFQKYLFSAYLHEA